MATSEEEVKECFKVFDTDNDSKIAISEIGLVIRALGTSSFFVLFRLSRFILFVLLVPLLFLHLQASVFLLLLS
jgi:hypothetical protein